MKDISIRELKRRMIKALNEDVNDGEYSEESVDDKPVKDLTVRDTLKMTRDINSGKKKVDNTNIKQEITPAEERNEQEKMENFFENNNVVIDFKELQLYPHGVFWGGTVDGQVQWVFKVTSYEETSGLDINILEGFQKDDTENEEIIQKLENYYNTFYKYWRDFSIT